MITGKRSSVIQYLTVTIRLPTYISVTEEVGWGKVEAGEKGSQNSPYRTA